MSIWNRGASKGALLLSIMLLLLASCGDSEQGVLSDLGLEGDALGGSETTVPATTATADSVPWRLGDDENFDRGWNACAEGVWEACDELWWVAPPGSEYSVFADSCGGRVASGEDWCFVVMNPGVAVPASVGDPSDPTAATVPVVAGGPPPLDQPKPNKPGGFAPPAGAGVSNQPANDRGDDATLDALWDACGLGDWVACDQLYLSSPFGSNYETFGSTCGGRVIGPSNGDCSGAVAAAPVAGDPQDYGDDIHLDELWDRCAARDWGSCDQLFRDAVSGSNYHAFGFTCGGLVAYSNGDCVNAGAGGIPAAGTPHDYGDDVYLDWLWDGCASGAWDDCDRLFNDSAPGSNYQAYGGRCGNRRADVIAQSCQGVMAPSGTTPATSAAGPVELASGTYQLMYDRDNPNEPNAYLDLDDDPPAITQWGQSPDFTTVSAKDLFWSNPCDDAQMLYEWNQRGTNSGCYVLSRFGSAHFLPPSGAGDYDDCVATLGTGVVVVQPLTVSGYVIPAVGLAQTRLCHLTDQGNISITFMSIRDGGKSECWPDPCGWIQVLEISYVTYPAP